MSENLAEHAIRSSYEQTVRSIRHSGVQEILRRAQEGTLEVTYRTAPQIGSASGAAERVEIEHLNSPEVRGIAGA